MRNVIAALPLVLAAWAPAVQARDVDVRLSLGFVQPGVVGRVDLGRSAYDDGYYGPPAPVYLPPHPVVMVPAPGYRHPHRHKHWRHRGGSRGEWVAVGPAPLYDRYGRPVVIVHERW